MTGVSKCIIKEMARRAWGWVRTFITGFVYFTVVASILICGVYLFFKLDESYPWIILVLVLICLVIYFCEIARMVIKVYKEVKEQCERCE